MGVKLKQRIRTCALVLIVALAGIMVINSSALACGTVRGWIAGYQRGLHYKALFHMLDCSSSYQAPADDIALLPIIADALKRGPKVANMARRVFRTYNFLRGARNEKGYQDVVKAVAAGGNPVSLSRYQGWLVVTAKSGANLRDQPSLQGKVLASVIYGMQVRPLGIKGEWIEVMPVGPGSVDPQFEGVIGFIHQSLLKPY